MLYVIFACLLLLSVNGLAPLRKHHYHIQSPIDETEIIDEQHRGSNMTHLYSSSESTCGEASLSCMAFGYSSSIPIRCGILKKSTVCERIDPVTKIVKCDAFCDTDGSGRLCEKAFPSCCKGSVHGCTSSKPRNIILYNKRRDATITD